ncbi:DUF104 domain-containing protein [Pyrococcus kukulkanii]|uniref:antitoxin AF2212-like protein n=1 Tax=Pyrococcus kukulkanii TaxID=1609559 RepID=UPI0035624F2B
MPIIVEAVYEGGVFKPLKKVNLKDGQKVKIKIELDVSKYYGGIRKSFCKRIKRTRRRGPDVIFVDTNMFYNFLFETELSPRAKGIIEMPYELVTSFTVLDELVYVVIRKLAEKR